MDKAQFIKTKAEQYLKVHGDLNGFLDSFPFSNTVGFEKNTLPIIKSVLNNKEQAMLVSTKSVDRSDRERLHKMEKDFRDAGRWDLQRSNTKKAFANFAFADAIATATYWESFEDSYSDDKVALAVQLHISSRTYERVGDITDCWKIAQEINKIS